MSGYYKLIYLCQAAQASKVPSRRPSCANDVKRRTSKSVVSLGDFKEEHFIIDPNHLQAEKEKTTHVRFANSN